MTAIVQEEQLVDGRTATLLRDGDEYKLRIGAEQVTFDKGDTGMVLLLVQAAWRGAWDEVT